VGAPPRVPPYNCFSALFAVILSSRSLFVSFVLFVVTYSVFPVLSVVQSLLMRILIPTVDYPPIEGGISSVAVGVSRALADMGHDVTIIAPWFEGMDEFDANEPATVIRFRGYHLGWFRFFPLLFKTWPHIRNHDLLLAINIAYGGIIGRWANIPFITFGYAYEFLKFRHTPIIGGMLRKAYNNSAHVVAISNYTRDNLEQFGVSSSKITTIFPGAPTAIPHAQEHLDNVRRKYVLGDGPLILSVGRLIPRKNHVALVRAMPAVLEAVPNASLLIVGRGPQVAEISRTANDLNVRDHVLLPGYVPDEELFALYDLCRVFALPALDATGGQVEGFGLVFAEAAAYGKPVVAGRSGGVSDAVIDGETGFVIDAHDETALADALIRLLTDDALANRMGEAGRNRVRDELNWKTFTERILDKGYLPLARD